MKIYLAGRYSTRKTLEGWANDLQCVGHEVVSRWCLRNSDHKLVDGLSPRAADHERLRFAQEDMEDVLECDAMISLMDIPRGNGRGGRHVEFGVALALEKELYIVGERETVFHHLPQVIQTTSWQECFKLIGGDDR